MESASKEMALRCTTEKVTASSLKKDMGVGKFVRSVTFTVGGYDWSIRFYPEGTTESPEGCMGICLELMSSNAEVRTFFRLGLVKHETGLIGSMFTPNNKVFSSKTRNSREYHLFILRSSLEAKPLKYLRDDFLVIKCNITVIKESEVYETMGHSEIEVPPSDIMEHLAKLLDTKEEADVTFSVGGETFQAHKILLAMRSPVFKAELFGPMKEKRMRCLTIKDMQPAVFKALLHFIYTDSLPDLDDLEGDDKCEMIRHLLVAADKYAMDRLKIMCQNILGKSLDVENVATTLALADQHNCDKLKDICIEFIASSDKMDDVVATKDVLIFLWDTTELSLEGQTRFYYPRSGLKHIKLERYQEDPLEDAHEDGQVPKSTDEENQRKESRTTPRTRTSGPCRPPLQQQPNSRSYRARTSGPSLDIRPPARKSGSQPRHPDKPYP
ncbi:unnamed protein product [Triticum turgidum subsp. durum]|uniref:Uncharacterized protein n=1 Tax=Triticum turgidum subsp. durum TaxID=4567 RepID=A0A9R1B208_TRITD|nr:unnamed protein product [Triticum turgidum subsp. durum]